MCPDSRILSNFPLFVKGFFAHPAGKALTAAAGGGEAKAKQAAARESPPPALPKGGGAPNRRKQANPEPQRPRGLDNGETLCYTINAPTGGGSESAFSVGPSPQGLGPLSLSRHGSSARNRTERRPRSPPLAGLAAGGCCIATRNLPAKETPSTTSSAGGAERPRPLFPCCHFSPSAAVRGRVSRPAPSLGSKRYPPPPPAFYKLLRGEREKTPPYDSGHFFAVAAQGAPSLVPLLVKGQKAEMTSLPL